MRTRRGVVVILGLLILSVSGCTLTGSKTPYAVHLYMPEYSSPVFSLQALDRTVRVDRFAVAHAYNSTAMFRRPEPYKIEPYNYHRWRANPGDMVTDFLSRDLKESRLFKAVFSHRDPEETDFGIEGSVGELLMARSGAGWQVVLSVDVSLLNMNKTAINERVLFQKRYSATEAIEKESPEAFAAGMSKALARVSTGIIGDVYEAMAKR